MVEPIAPEPVPPVSKATIVGVGIFVLALVALLLAIPDAEPKIAPDVLDPAKLYGQNCAVCHGAAGEGKGKFPKVAGTKLTEAEIVKLMEEGKGDMPRFEATAEQREALARYVKGMK